MLWARRLPCGAVGTASLNAATHVLAVPLFKCPTGVTPSVQLFDEADGTLLGQLPTTAKVFAQPVFASGELLVATEGAGLSAYAP